MIKSNNRAFISNKNESIALVENKWLDKLTRTPIAVPIVLFVLYAIGLLYWAALYTSTTLLQSTSLFFTGFIFFTLLEYLIHRNIFHKEEEVSPDALQYKLHGVHHDYPKDKLRLAMPPIMSISIVTALLFLSELIINHFAFSFLAGFVLGYALYLFVHYAVHVFRKPKNFLKILWTNHAIHHYHDHHVAYGVTSPFWDFLFGTNPKKGKKKNI